MLYLNWVNKMITVLVICPYNLSILKGITSAANSKIANIIVMGSKRRIMELCYIYEIPIKTFEIIEVETEIDICFEANEIITKRNIDIVIYGFLSKELHKNIISCDFEIKVIDIPKLNHLIFAPINTSVSYISYDEKIDAIFNAREFLVELGIKNFNIGLIDDIESKTAVIERNIIHLNPELNKEVVDIISIKEMYSDNYNIIIFNSMNSLNIFIDTLLDDHSCKCASIKKASDIYIIDAYNLTAKDILFSLFLISKVGINTKAS